MATMLSNMYDPKLRRQESFGLAYYSDPKHFTAAMIAKVIATVVFILTAVWVTLFIKSPGLAWNSNTVFNLHPFSMTLGPIMLATWGSTIYRSMPAKKRWSKTMHASLNILAVALAGLGLAAVIVDKLNSGEQHFYSAHSWVGITTIALFAMQVVAGFTVYAIPVTSSHYREWIKPYHAGLGMWTVVSACIAASLGVLESQQGATKNTYAYEIPNAIVLLLFFLVGFLLYTLVQPRTSLEVIKRQVREGVAEKTEPPLYGQSNFVPADTRVSTRENSYDYTSTAGAPAYVSPNYNIGTQYTAAPTAYTTSTTT